ncbi:MFS transporter [Stenotrophomonas humi]|uniref:MFS transporter n=1 Tax=Stenotrophomonas humi TaxID=405444 RepID=UPI000A59B61D|nr:MFS transporter [Stenotrophomonas humi]
MNRCGLDGLDAMELERNGAPACRESLAPAAALTVVAEQPHILQGTTEFRRAVLALFMAGFATFGVLYCVQSLLPGFSHHFGVSAGNSALALSVSTGMLAVAMLVAGIISDRIGRRPVMVVSLLGSALLTLATALVDDWSTLLVLRTLLGVSLSGVPAVAMTWLVEEMDSRSLGLAMGLYIGGNAVGGMSGRLIAGVVADHWGWRMGIAAVGVIALLATVMLWTQLPASRHFRAKRVEPAQLPARFAGLFRDAALPWLFACGFLLLGVFVTLYNYLGYYLLAPPYGLSQTVVGLIFTVYLVGSVSSAWMGQLASRIGRGPVLALSFGLMLWGVVLLMLPWLATMALGIALATFGFFGGHSVASSWVGVRAGGMRAEASALYLFSYYLGSSVLGALGGVFYTHWGWAGVCGFTLVLVLLGVGVAWRLWHQLQVGTPAPLVVAGR